MENLLKITTKNLSQTEPGELIRLKAGHSYNFAIVLRDGEHPVLGFLNKIHPNDQRDIPQPQCFYVSPTHDPIVASYGVDWVVFPITTIDSEVGKAVNIEEHSGVLHIDQAVNLISFIGFNEMQEPLSFSTETWQPSNYTRPSTISFKDWDIWRSKEHFDKFPQKPLISIRA
ncbi:hypothetical protein Brsp07_01887 [Brucella sp. NBRC 14130]|uniref:hypothetical protein n=1 Tax=Brucella sp. NBRC 14130 TaxID=3075483 RepID=UPI0030A8491A